MIAAAVNFEIGRIDSPQAFTDHCCSLLDRCAGAGAELVVFPECFSLELLGLEGGYVEADVPALIDPERLEPAMAHARSLNLIWIAGSTFFATDAGFENACPVVFPSGELVIQPKLVMTQFELHEWGVMAGAGLRELPDSRLAVTICYDAEFPESGRILAERGVLVQCVPAFTETEHGFHRVRHCVHARAVENQVFVIHASLVGTLGREPVPSTWGSSAVLAPCALPFPAKGVLAETAFNREDICVAELDFEMLQKARESGDVRNWLDRHAARWEV